MKCSETALELSAELEELRIGSRGGFRQATSKTFRAFRRKQSSKELQRRLEQYRTTLDTRILVDLRRHSLQHMDDLQSLDQRIRDLITGINIDQRNMMSLDRNVKDLIVGLAQGQTTVTELLENQGQSMRDHMDQLFNLGQTAMTQTVINEGQSIRDHFDRRHDTLAQVNREVEVQQRFKNSLFFPEIFERGEGICVAHQGTCRWIFESRSNFILWLNSGDGLYWLNGKPGSGKSTLMKYVTSELFKNAESKEAVTKWANSSELLVASFFFWALGNTILQKNLQGLLRSLLYQIADQRKDLIHLMMDTQIKSSEGSMESSHPDQPHTWTEERLFATLQRFLSRKPSSVSCCFFIDGLDEFAGDEDKLMETLHLLVGTPQIKLCASSRTEQIFRLEFSHSPQLRLQEFNRRDIRRAVEDKLLPTLQRHVPQEKEAVNYLIERLIVKAEGVFLWLDLVVKDIIKGIRCEDNVDELKRRLERTPNTIDGLYGRMLDRLDDFYRQEAFQCFLIPIAKLAHVNNDFTLLHFACATSGPWEHTLKNDLSYFSSQDFHDTCQKVETRLLTRCAGLVEIDSKPCKVIFEVPYVNRFTRDTAAILRLKQGQQYVSRHLRQVRFIHRTVMEFLEKEHQAISQKSDWSSIACLNLLRGCLGMLINIQTFISEENDTNTKTGVADISGVVQQIVDWLATAGESIAIADLDQDSEHIAVELVDQSYNIIELVDRSIDGPSYHSQQIARENRQRPPWGDSHGFAAFCGCSIYISRHLYSHNYSSAELDYLFECSLIGLMWVDERRPQLIGHFNIIGELLHRGSAPNKYLHPTSFTRFPIKVPCILSFWGAFLQNAVPAGKPRQLYQRIEGPSPKSVEPAHLGKGPTSDGHIQNTPLIWLWKALIESFLSHGADANTSVFELVRTRRPDYHANPPADPGEFFFVEESPLSYLERKLALEDPSLMRSIGDSLRMRGALEKRRFRHIIKPKVKLYQVSVEQSQRLCEVWQPHSGRPIEENIPLHDAFLEMEASLTTVTGMDPYRSSWDANCIDCDA